MAGFARKLAGGRVREYPVAWKLVEFAGGDGRIGNAFGGSSTTCPGCRGNGRRSDSESLLRDVTKTKPSHHRAPVKPNSPVKDTGPTTFEGAALAKEVQSSGLPDDTKARLVREIVEYEGSHGRCTQTFSKKIRRQVRPPTSS